MVAHFFKRISIGFSVLFVAIFSFPLVSFAVASGDGKIIYSISGNTTPQDREYIDATNTFNTAVGTVSGGTALQTVLRASPTQNEFIGGYVDSTGTLRVMCYNGTSWSNEWSVAVGGTGTTRRFDISYETSSGDAIVLYSTNTTTTNELAYRTKLGSTVCGAANWSAGTNLNPVRTSGIVQWVKMAWDKRAGQNLITAIWADSQSDLSAMVWSGSAWGNEPGSAVETALEIVATGQDVESFDVEYESLSGDVMIVHGSGGSNGTNGGYYSTCVGGTSACTWTLRTAMPTLSDDTTHIDISGDPNSDRILFGAIGNTGSDLTRGVWSGTAWTNTANADTSCNNPTAGTKFVATGWLTSGGNTRGILVYYDASGTSSNLSWMTLNNTTWTTQTDFTSGNTIGTHRNYSIEIDPINEDRVIFTVGDANSDIHAKRIVLSGTTFTWSNSTGGGPIEANTASARYKTFAFAHYRFIPTPPSLTSYTNSTESGLNYSGACTGCGARIGSGAFIQTVVISGTGFGTDPGAGNRSSASNNIKVGAHQIPDANVSAWSTTSITITTNTANDADSAWGTEFGGATALTVTAGGLTSSGLNFYVFPQVTSVTSIVLDAAREYDAGDSDGVITLNGTRFGTAQTGGYVRILGCDSSTCSSPTGSVTTTAWSNTSITAQVPTVIADNVYTGSLVMQQGTGSNNKTHTYTASGFRILPRITSLAPSSGSISDAITVNGNHLCQTGTCPVAFSGTNKVTFTSAVDATTFTSWSHTAVATAVPTGTVTGNVVVTSNSYTSNGSLFTLVSPVPSDPTSLNQYFDSGLTQQISVGGAASSTPIYLTMTMQAPVSGGTLYPQIEYKDTSTNFTCSGSGACGAAVEGNGFASPGPVDCTVSNCKIAISPSDNTYHWQARIRHNKSGIDYYSNWVSFGGNADPGATDFQIDTTAPVITLVSSGTPGSNTATITWSTAGELSSSQVQYAEGSPITFGACSGDCTSITDTSPRVFTHSVTLTNLSSGTTYSFRVRSKDAAGNEAISTPTLTFATQSVTDPAKTVRFHIVGKTTATTNASPLSQPFSVVIPENATTTKSIFVELQSVYVTTSGSPTVTLQVNSETAKVYTLPTTAATSHAKILHGITTIVVDPGTNTLTVTPDANTTLYGLSADVVVNYSYTP